MKKTIYRAFACALALLMIAAAFGCSTTAKAAATPSPAPAAEEAAPAEAPAEEAESALDDDAVAAKVGDRLITRGEVAEVYDYYVQMMTYYGMGAPTAEEDIESYQDYALEALISHAKQLYYADRMGLSALTEEEEAKIKTAVAEIIEQYMADYRATVTAEGAEDVEAAAKALFEADLAAYGMNMTMDEYIAYAEQNERESLIIEKLQKHYMDQAEVTEEAARTAYEEQLTLQTEALEADPLSFADTASYYDMEGGVPAIVVPEGFLRVNLITIYPESELGVEYSDQTAAMTKLEAEYGKLALQGGDEARMAEIRVSYEELRTNSEALMASYSEASLKKAAEAKALLDGGASFAEVRAQYNEDHYYDDYPAVIERGEVLCENTCDDGWNEDLRSAAVSLEDGQYSEVINLNGTCYILYRMGAETPGTRAYEEVAEAMMAYAKTGAGADAWEAVQVTWESDNSMVILYEDVYRSIGK